MLYAHTNNNDYFGPTSTFALIPPTKEDLHRLFTLHGTQTIIIYGLSITSEHDRFEKKIGREVAEQRLAPRVINFERVEIVNTKHVYFFNTEIKVGHIDYLIQFQLTTTAESDVVKLIKVAVT